MDEKNRHGHVEGQDEPACSGQDADDQQDRYDNFRDQNAVLQLAPQALRFELIVDRLQGVVGKVLDLVNAVKKQAAAENDAEQQLANVVQMRFHMGPLSMVHSDCG